MSYLSLAEVLKVGVVEVDESALELSVNHGNILKRIPTRRLKEIYRLQGFGSGSGSAGSA